MIEVNDTVWEGVNRAVCNTVWDTLRKAVFDTVFDTVNRTPYVILKTNILNAVRKAVNSAVWEENWE